MFIGRRTDKKAVVRMYTQWNVMQLLKRMHPPSNEVDETGAYYTELSQKEKHQYSILTHIYEIQKDGNDDPICKTAKETQMYRTDCWTLGERERVG